MKLLSSVLFIAAALGTAAAPAPTENTIRFAGREKITVWASFDGGTTWPVKRLVYSGPSACSNLGVGRAGTPSAGKIYLHFEGGPKHCYDGVMVAVFNLAWLLDGRDLRALLPSLARQNKNSTR